MLERTEGKCRGRGRERAREEGGNTEGGEKVCDRGRENQKRKREDTMLREGMDIKCKQKCVKKKKKCVLKYTAGAGSVCINIATC